MTPSAMANGLIGSREHYWLTSKVLSTAVRAHAIGSVTLRTSQRALGDRVCAGQRGVVGAEELNLRPLPCQIQRGPTRCTSEG
jgi:hypothetical protein